MGSEPTGSTNQTHQLVCNRSTVSDRDSSWLWPEQSGYNMTSLHRFRPESSGSNRLPVFWLICCSWFRLMTHHVLSWVMTLRRSPSLVGSRHSGSMDPMVGTSCTYSWPQEGTATLHAVLGYRPWGNFTELLVSSFCWLPAFVGYQQN